MCLPNYFRSVLDVIPKFLDKPVEELEDLTQEQLDYALKTAMDTPEFWAAY